MFDENKRKLVESNLLENREKYNIAFIERHLKIPRFSIASFMCGKKPLPKKHIDKIYNYLFK